MLPTGLGRTALLATQGVAEGGRSVEPAHVGSVVRGQERFAPDVHTHPSLRRPIGCLLASVGRTEDPILAADSVHAACLSSWFAGSAGHVGQSMPPEALDAGSPRWVSSSIAPAAPWSAGRPSSPRSRTRSPPRRAVA